MALSGAALAQTEDPGLYLFQIPSVRAVTDAGRLGETVEADFHVPNAENPVDWFAGSSLSILATERGLVRIAVGTHETLASGPAPAHLAATFVIDYDEPSVAKLVGKLRERHGSRPSLDELVRFVDAAIVNKSFRRNFDLASQVASSGEGDCTEHAVLLAALSRATERPARVVMGIMLVETGERVLAFGHAWAEMHDGSGWRIADATRPELQLPSARPRYVPMMALDNEGPGYALQVATLATAYPARIDRIKTAEPVATLQQSSSDARPIY